MVAALCDPLDEDKISVYFLGDSTHERLYTDGLIPYYNCSVIDPNIRRHTEAIENYYERNRGRICFNHNVSRIGYMFHWGVATKGDYARSWSKHRMYSGNPGSTYVDTKNSHKNIELAIYEFQNRTRNDNHKVVFILLSAMWDGYRYIYQYKYRMHFNDLLQEYQKDYSQLLLKIMPLMRKQDTLVLQTSHYIKEWDKTIPVMKYFNDKIRKIARFFSLPLFDVNALLGENFKKYLYDSLHQKKFASLMLAKQIRLQNWTVPIDCLNTLTFELPPVNATITAGTTTDVGAGGHEHKHGHYHGRKENVTTSA